MSESPLVQPDVATVRVVRSVVRRLGEWTRSAFDVHVVGGLLDLISAGIDCDEIDVPLDVDGGLVSLSVPPGARAVDALRWVGPGHRRNWTRSKSTFGRGVRLSGEVHWGDALIRRGSVSIPTPVRYGGAHEIRRACRTRLLAPNAAMR